MKTIMNDIDAHLRTRLRVIIWKQWKAPKKRQWGLQKLGIGKEHAKLTCILYSLKLSYLNDIGKDAGSFLEDYDMFCIAICDDSILIPMPVSVPDAAYDSKLTV